MASQNPSISIMHLIQASFTAGEISPEVATRVDLDKFASALLQAKNGYVRPYGSVYKRGGLKFCVATKYADKKAILVNFNFSKTVSYMLEFGDLYMRVHKNGEWLGFDVATPFTEDDLPNLRFAQSIDVLYIASGAYPVKTLTRYDESTWTLDNFEVSHSYYDPLSGSPTFDGNAYLEPGTYTFTPKVSGNYTIEVAGAGAGASGRIVVPGNAYSGIPAYSERNDGGNGAVTTSTVALTASTNYTVVVGAIGSTGTDVQSPAPYDGQGPTVTAGGGANGGQSSFNGTAVVAAGGVGATGKSGYGYLGGTNVLRNYIHITSAGADGANSGNGLGGVGEKWDYSVHNNAGAGTPAKPGWVKITFTGNNKITPSAKTGSGITLTALKDTFLAGHVGDYIKLFHEIASTTVSLTTGTSASVLCGSTWTIITHGTWTGNVVLQKSKDNATWVQHRKYTSANDYNATESDAVEEYCYLRVIVTTTSGTCTCDLTCAPYTHEGTARITAVANSMSATADVKEDFGATSATEYYSFGPWCSAYGYPGTVAFFQDRLCFGANDKYPHMVWMSRTGDYNNFGKEEAAGALTDDSAVAIAFLSRTPFRIRHLIPSTDLMVFTEGNSWIISGAETVTPAQCTPKPQNNIGCGDCEPIEAGGRLVYTSLRGGAVYDMGYTFESDKYKGDDLTTLAKHLIENHNVVDDAFKQEPDSLLYFVRDDGVMLCLTYLRDQNVYGWSKLETDGTFEAVVTTVEGLTDVIYTIVKRTINGSVVRNIESFVPVPKSANPDDYNMLDCSAVIDNETPTSLLTGLEHLAGETVDVVADSIHYAAQTVTAQGELTLVTNVSHAVVGMPYTSVFEVPNVEVSMRDGTLQGRKKKVTETLLRLTNSVGGKIGIVADTDYMDDIEYDEMNGLDAVTLFTGDKKITMPNGPEGGFEDTGRVVIYHDQPYPFSLAAIIRTVALGG